MFDRNKRWRRDGAREKKLQLGADLHNDILMLLPVDQGR
jgi:hypothetical protein